MIPKMKLTEVLNWIVTISNAYKEVPEEIKERMPGFLGLSLADEQIFAGVMAQLTEPERKLITDLLNSFKDYEKNRFRNVVAGIPTMEYEATENGKIIIKKGTKQTAVKFLRRLAKVVAEDGPEEARKQCLVGGVIVEDPLHQKALRIWRKSVNWFKKILDELQAQSLAELWEKLEKIDQKADKWLGPINEKLEKWQGWVEEQEARPWYKKILWN